MITKKIPVNIKEEHKQIKLGDMALDVVHKNIKNLHLSVYPPTGRVHISAPTRMKLDTVRIFAISKLSWIKKQRNKFLTQNRETQREYVSRESHYYLGRRYLLKVIEHNAPPEISIKHETIEMCIRPNTDTIKRERLLNEWYRQNLKEIIPEIVEKYEKLLKINVNEFGIRKMRTRWGTCNINAKRIWLNLELAKKERHYIEYITVHEILHLLERRHNERFVAYMDKILPQWKTYKEELNRAPLGHVYWSY